MTRFSATLVPTLKDAPADATAVSHQLMVRAGLIRQVGPGTWSLLPAGRRVERKVEQILGEEMEAIGCQEMLMPLATGDLETVVGHIGRELRSYRDLPLALFQIQVVQRDEPRPRAGLLRAREFTMAAAYSFDRDLDGLAQSYAAQAGAYERVLDRCGLDWHRCAGDAGTAAGLGAEEFMAPSVAGESELALAPGYAANLRVASTAPRAVDPEPPLPEPEPVETPGATTMKAVAEQLGVPAAASLKAIAVHSEGRGVVLVMLRGDHRLNETKLRGALAESFRAATPEEVEEAIGPPGYIGPVGTRVPVIKDAAIDQGGYVCGANRPGFHLRGVQAGRDWSYEEHDVRMVEAGDPGPSGGEIRIEPAIKLGRIVKVGTRDAEALGATFLAEDGAERPLAVGSYGIGPGRVVAAAIEQRADERGIVWSPALAPWAIHLVTLAKPGEPERQFSDRLYEELRGSGAEVIYDDRAGGAGQKLTDAELLGCPLRVVVGRRGLARGVVEAQERASGVDHELPAAEAAARLRELSASVGSGGRRAAA